MKVTDPCYCYPAKPIYLPPSSEAFDKLDNDTNWVAEVKKNGWRCMVRVTPSNKIMLWTRHKTVEMSPLPNLRKELAALKLPPDTILDGELLEHRGKTKETLMLWGMFKWNGTWLNTLSYKETMWRMNFITKDNVHIIKPDFVLEGKKKFYEDVLRSGDDNEGIVIKKLDAPVPFSFTSTPHARSMIKVKPNAS